MCGGKEGVYNTKERLLPVCLGNSLSIGIDYSLGLEKYIGQASMMMVSVMAAIS